MPRLTLLRLLPLCLMLLAAPASASVRALLFEGPACSDCADFYDFLLPALQERFGERLELASVDTSTAAGAAVLEAAMARGLVPAGNDSAVVLAGGHTFVGLDAIAAGLGDDFESLAADPASEAWPDLAGLQELLPTALQRERERTAAIAALPAPVPDEHEDTDRIANGLAIAVLAGMILALLHGLVRARRATPIPKRHAWLVPLLMVVGLAISGYTAYTSLAGVAVVCGPIGSCNTVQQSEYAKLFGIPLGVLGVLGYAVILVAWAVARRWSPKGGGWFWLPWGIALFGTLFSTRLTFLEPFVIGHTCLWCLGSAVAMTITYWVLSGTTGARPG